MSNNNWVDALAASELPNNDVKGFVVAGRDIAIYAVEGALYATDNTCTHGNARLCDGYLLDHEIECPLHQGRFDVRSGLPSCAPAALPLRCYPVRVEGGRVFVQMDEGQGD